MWDTVVETTGCLSHDLPCPRCGHAAHRFLPCSEACRCGGWEMSDDPQHGPLRQATASVLVASLDAC